MSRADRTGVGLPGTYVEPTEDRKLLRAVDGLASVVSRAPCWWCSLQLQGFHGYEVEVDGNKVVVHKACAREMVLDDDFRRRVAIGQDGGGQ